MQERTYFYVTIPISLQDVKEITKPAGELTLTTKLETVENYVKPGLITAILKTGHDLVPVLDLNSPDVTAGHLYKAGRL